MLCLICSTHKWNYSYSHMLSGAACWRYSVGLPKYLLFYMKFGMKLKVNPVQCLLQTRCPATVMEVCLERQRCSWDRYGNLSAWHTHTHTTSVCNKINLKAKIEIYCKVTVLAGTVQVLMCVCVSRCGPLFNTGFLRRMLSAAVQHSMDDIQPLVKTLICESECTTLKSLVHGPSALTNQGKPPTSHLSSVTCEENSCLQNIVLPLCSGVWSRH